MTEQVTPNHLGVEFDDGVVTLTLQRPPLNVFDRTLQKQLAAAVHDIADDPAVHVVIVTGAGRAFSAGADLKELADLEYEQIADWNRALQRTFTEVAALPVPVIAAVNGAALGGGLELALAADFRLAADRATMGLPEVQLGIVPGAGGIQRLSRLVGPSTAKQLLMSGRRVDAHEAASLGIVEEVVDGADLMQRARSFAGLFRDGPRFAVQAIKESVDLMGDAPLSAGLAMDRHLLAGLFGTRDRKIGMASFLADGPGKARFGRSGVTQ